MTLKRFLKLYAFYAKMDMAWLLRDPMFSVTAVVCDIISNLSSVGTVFLLAWSFGGIGGMNRYEVLVMLAYTTLVDGVFTVFFANANIGHISRRIGRGQLDHMFIQPMPLITQILTEGFIPFTGSSSLITGGVLMAVALHLLGIIPPWWWIFALLGSLALTLIIIIASSYLASSITFYAPVQAEEISTYIIDTQGSISRYPLSGMPRPAQYVLLSVIPAGLLGWFPTLALLGKAPINIPAWYPVLFAALLSAIAAYTFRKGLNYYVKKGINRYLAFGHRR